MFLHFVTILPPPSSRLKEIYLGLQSWIFLRPRLSSSNLWICRMKKSPYLGGEGKLEDSIPAQKYS